MPAQVKVRAADIPMGMTQVEDGDAKVLFIRDKTGLRAFQATCPHYGAPLANGRLCGRTLYCPWHKAAFDVGDGSLREPPALRGLPQYPISFDGERVIATLEPMSESKPSSRSHDPRVFLIVGTGAAAVSAVTTLRREGYGGRILAIGRERGEPYDRTKLSKTFLAKRTEPSDVVLEPDFFASHGVEFVVGPAVRIEPDACRVTLPDGRTLTGDTMLVATGSRAVVPSFPGGDLKNIFSLRSLSDATALSAAADTAASIVIVGGGFIGLEAAAFLAKRGLAPTIVVPERLPLAKRFGEEVASALKGYHEGNRITFVNDKVARFEGEDGVRGVRLAGGNVIATDLVLIATGAAPETDALIGMARRHDGGIEVGPDLRVAPQTWLAGDIAAVPSPSGGAAVRIEHWRLAEQHGAHAARGMMGRLRPSAARRSFGATRAIKGWITRVTPRIGMRS
jgi:NADPH-dependent 2,4-dienoyl-CoA reductase/sulfur reductase-like enzyme/nitrite reductase/ring-hydroxylating ferredoxin subunit